VGERAKRRREENVLFICVCNMEMVCGVMCCLFWMFVVYKNYMWMYVPA